MVDFTRTTMPKIQAEAEKLKANPVLLDALKAMTPEFEELLAEKDKNIIAQTTQNGYGYWMGHAKALGVEVVHAFALWLAINEKNDDLEGLLDGWAAATGKS